MRRSVRAKQHGQRGRVLYSSSPRFAAVDEYRIVVRRGGPERLRQSGQMFQIRRGSERQIETDAGRVIVATPLQRHTAIKHIVMRGDEAVNATRRS